MQQEYNCPYCRSPIGLDDVNVSTDIALCRDCGKTSSFALMTSIASVSQEDLLKTPRHVRVVKNPMHGTTLTYRKKPGILLFLIPFTLFWSGISMGGIYGAQIANGHFDLAKSLFGLPFLIGTVILVSVILFMLFGRWQIRLHRGNGEVFVGINSFGWTRKFTFNRDSVISLRESSYRVNNVPQKAIHISNDGHDFMFGSTMNDEAKQYIAAFLVQETQSAPLKGGFI